MTNIEKQKLITEIVTLLQSKLEVDIKAESAVGLKPEKRESSKVEMLTIKECASAVKGLSEHTVRQLVAQGKIPHIRTGAGKCGKILISKSALLGYFNEGGAA